jgi:HAMP domain-containing protein
MASVETAPAPRRAASIRAQLLWLLAAAALPLIALQAWSLYDAAKDDERSAQEQVLHLADVTASETARFLDQTRNILNGLAARPAVRALDPTRCDPLPKDFLALAPRFANVVTVTAAGLVVCSVVPLPAGRPFAADPQSFRRFRESDQFAIGDPVKGPFTGRWLLPLGRTLQDAQGAIAGRVALMLDLANLPVLPSIAGLPANTIVGIVDSNGTLIARSHQAASLVGTNQRTLPIVAQALARSRGTSTATGPDGVTRVYGFTAIPGTGWIAVAGTPVSEVYAGARARIANSALIAIAIMFAALVLATWLSRRIRDPIAALAATAGEVAAGNLAVRAPLAGSAEIAEVAAQFNRMLDARAGAEEALRASEQRTS